MRLLKEVYTTSSIIAALFATCVVGLINYVAGSPWNVAKWGVFFVNAVVVLPWTNFWLGCICRTVYKAAKRS